MLWPREEWAGGLFCRLYHAVLDKLRAEGGREKEKRNGGRKKEAEEETEGGRKGRDK